MPLTKIKSLGITDGAIVAADIASGAITAAKLASGVGGKVLQVVHTTYQSQATTSSPTPSDISGFSATITPSSASNKVLVFVNIQMGGVGNSYGYFLLLRGSTSLIVGNGASGSQVNTFVSSGYIDGVAAMRSGSNSYLDSPNTTSATTYKIQIASGNSNAFYINRQDQSANGAYTQFPVSSITLLEIAG